MLKYLFRSIICLEKKELFQVFLTSRQLEILELVSKGASNKEIALKLGIALPTVKNHIRDMRYKFTDNCIIDETDFYSGQGHFCKGKTTTKMIDFAANNGWISPVNRDYIGFLKGRYGVG